VTTLWDKQDAGIKEATGEEEKQEETKKKKLFIAPENNL